MSTRSRTAAFESWLSDHTEIVAADLRYKHGEMSRDPFPFLRATYYRWTELWPEVCPDLHDALAVLAVGDLHVENFGSWRDAEGRLAWGINDFDEAAPLPYTNDLVRLATSALLTAAKIKRWSLSANGVCGAILEGYRDGLKKGGRPFVIAEENTWFVPMIRKGLRDPEKFWKKLSKLPEIREKQVPDDARALLTAAMPDSEARLRYARRSKAGLGSLGKPRILALAEWRGGLVAREAKALTPPASSWSGGESKPRPYFQEIIAHAVRCPDPFLRVLGDWVVRRLAPDCSKIELSSLRRVEDQERQLYAMGWETANVHVGRGSAAMLLRDMTKRPRRWLPDAAAGMLKATKRDWKEWRSRTL